MEEELEELKNAAGAGGASAPAGTMYSEEQVNDMVERRTAKLRKKYEKRITGLKADLQEVTDEFQYQRQMLADALAEQEKDGKLFETACRALLSDREMKKLVEKSKWMEEEEEWVIPPLKRSDRGGDSSAHLPDIGVGGGQHQGGGGRSGGGGSGYASLGHGSDGEAGSAGSSGSSLYPPIAQRGHGGAMPSSSGAGTGSSGQLASIRAPGGSQQGGYGPSTGHGHSSNAVHLPATSSSVALPSIGGPASNRSRNISPRFEPDERKAYDPDAMGPGASGQQRLGQHRSRPTSKHARPGSNTQFAALPQPSQQQQFLPQGQAYGHYHVEDGSDGVSDDPRLADKKKKKRRKKKSKSGGGGGAGASDEWGFLVADGDAADGEPEYSDDEVGALERRCVRAPPRFSSSLINVSLFAAPLSHALLSLSVSFSTLPHTHTLTLTDSLSLSHTRSLSLSGLRGRVGHVKYEFCPAWRRSQRALPSGPQPQPGGGAGACQEPARRAGTGQRPTGRCCRWDRLRQCWGPGPGPGQKPAGRTRPQQPRRPRGGLV